MTLRNLSKSDLIGAVWRDFYDTLKTNVTSVTLADATTSTIVTYTNSYPDKTIISGSSFPILVINSPNIDWSTFTLGKARTMGTIDIEVFSTSNQAADLFSDDVQNSIETNKDDLRVYGLTNIQLSTTSSDTFFHGDIKVHVKIITFTFEFIFAKTGSY